MNRLYHLQKSLQRYLLESDSDIKEAITDTAKVSAETRLGVYSHAYHARLIDTLADSYSVLHTYLGAKEFEELAQKYIHRYPSAYRSIRWFGDKMPQLLREPPYHTLPYLAELAELEWTMGLVFDAKDSPVMTIETIQQVPPDSWADMYLNIHPTVHRLNCAWNSGTIWDHLSQTQIPPQPTKLSLPEAWILWRRDLVCQYRLLKADEAWAIDALIQGKSFGEICEGLCDWFDEEAVAVHAASLLRGWIIAGFIADITIGENQNEK